MPMAKFEFFNVGRIVFGRGQLARVGDLAAGLGSAALVVTNADAKTLGQLVERIS